MNGLLEHEERQDQIDAEELAKKKHPKFSILTDEQIDNILEAAKKFLTPPQQTQPEQTVVEVQPEAIASQPEPISLQPQQVQKQETPAVDVKQIIPPEPVKTFTTPKAEPIEQIPAHVTLPEKEKIERGIEFAEKGMARHIAERGLFRYPTTLDQWLEQSKQGRTTIDYLSPSLIRMHMEFPELFDDEKRISASKEIERQAVKKLSDWIPELASDLLIFAGSTHAGRLLASKYGLGIVGAALAATLIGGTVLTLKDIIEGKDPAPTDAIDHMAGVLAGQIPLSAMKHVFEWIRTKPGRALSVGGQVINTPQHVGKFEQFTQKVVDVLRKPLEMKFIPLQIFGESWARFGARSIAELFQPAIERLRRDMPEFGHEMTRISFVRSAIEEKKNELLRDIARLRSEGKLKEVAYLLHGLSKGGMHKSAPKEAVDVFNKFTKPPALSQRQVELLYPEEIAARLAEDIKTALPTGLTHGSLSLVGRLQNLVKQRASGKKIDDVLRELSMDASIPQRMRDFIRSGLFLSKTDFSGLNRAIDSLIYRDVVDLLMEHPNMWWTPARKTPKPKDFVPAKGLLEFHKKFLGKEVWLHRDVALELESWKYAKEYANKFTNRVLNSPMKTFQVLIRPATQVRNNIGNIILNDIGGLPFFRVDIYKKAIEGMINKDKTFVEFMESIGRSPLAVGQLEFSQESIRNLFKTSKTALDLIIDAYEHGPKKLGSWLFENSEIMAKYAKYLHNLEKGMTKLGATLDAMKYTFNYGEQTRVVAKIASSFFGHPYARWYTKSIPMVVEEAIKHPWRILKWFGLYKAMTVASLQALGMSEDEWLDLKEKMPHFLEHGLVAPLFARDDKGRLIIFDAGYFIPGIGDLYDLIRSISSKQSPLYSVLAPIIQHPMSEVLNVMATGKTYEGYPVFYEHEKPAIKAIKTFGFLASTFAPILRDMAKGYETLIGTPESLTAPEFAAKFFGAPIYPLSEHEIARRHFYEKRKTKGEISSEYYRGRRRGEDVSELARRRSEYLRELQD